MTAVFLHDVEQQPQNLLQLVATMKDDALQLPPNLPPPLLTGMGASYHAARMAADHFQAQRQAAHAVEATELLFYGAGYFAAAQPLIFVSQSGESAEVTPVAARLADDAYLCAVTNSPNSTLAQRADLTVLTAAAPEEALVASKTYVNSIAALWLLVRRWCGVSTPADLTAIERLVDRCAALIQAQAAHVDLWMSTLDDAETLLFTGHGPGAITARHTAMMLGEWAKTPTLAMSLGAFRHGPIECARPGMSVVIFSSPGPAHRSAVDLAEELTGYGVKVLIVAEGESYTTPAHLPAQGDGIDPFLAPVLDVIPAQLFCAEFARRRQIDTTFRHIDKVITRI